MSIATVEGEAKKDLGGNKQELAGCTPVLQQGLGLSAAKNNGRYM